MALMNSELAHYRDEFRYVFYAVDVRYEETLCFSPECWSLRLGGFGDSRSGA
jgi:hypothetical protein